MPWKDGYTISDEKTLFDDEIRWPGGKQLCMTVMLDLSLASGPQGLTAADLRHSPATFGMNEGLAQVRDVLNRYGIKATVTVPAAMARIMPDAILALRDDGHEIAAQGLKHEDVSTLDREEEAARLAMTTEILETLTGQRPEGWFSLPRPKDPFGGGTVSANTHELLIEAGYRYMGNGLSDDIPHYWVTDFESQRAILTLPYFYPFRRPILPDVPQERHRAGTCRYPVRQLERGIRRAVPARPLFQHDPAPLCRGLVQPAETA